MDGQNHIKSTSMVWLGW